MAAGMGRWAAWMCLAGWGVSAAGCGDSASSGTPTDALDDAVTIGDVEDGGVADDGGEDDVRVDAAVDSGVDVGDGSGDAGTDVEVGIDAADGAIGTPCETNSDCESDLCTPISTDGSRGICTDWCLSPDDCPDGFACVVLPGTGLDERAVCVATDLCIDPDDDGYGDGPGCLGADCDQELDVVHVSAEEVCDGLDNDCDESIDENAAGVGVDCETGFLGPCAPGRVACDNGGLVCVADVAPSPERCDGVDNDCDGDVDNDATDVATFFQDADGDRFGADATAVVACSAPAGYESVGGDCDDAVRSVNPTAVEVCDGIDNDCDGATDGSGAVGVRTWFVDADDDGYGAGAAIVSCTTPVQGVERDGDCDDANVDAFPRAPELCDTVDNDCDGTVDEDGVTTWYADTDGDGFGDVTRSLEVCGRPAGYVANASDCDDSAAAVRPTAAEVCNGIDDNCADGIDEPAATDAQVWYADVDGDAFGAPGTALRACDVPLGYVGNDDDCDDAALEVNPDGVEFCDGIDNNCVAGIDENAAVDALLQYRDADGDDYGDAAAPFYACDLLDGNALNDRDCNDRSSVINPMGTEACNGVDDDCDVDIDEGDAVGATTWYADGDGDTYGNAASTLARCAVPVGYVGNDDDCDDGNAAVSPAGIEACNGIDDNCAGGIDEGAAVGASTWYADADRDTFGNPTATLLRCVQPPGYVADSSDCDDRSNAISPLGSEACNGVDDDCDLEIDEGAAVGATTWFADGDGDTYGNAAVTLARCAVPAGYVGNDDDCNDGNAAVSPAGVEACNGIDDNCAGGIDEGAAVGSSTWYEDGDRDTFGNPASALLRCAQPAGFVANSSDCDDRTNAISPLGTETCNGVDDDCDVQIDEGAAVGATTWYADGDGDTYGNAAVTLARCAAPAGYVGNDDDCNDGNAAVSPAGVEACNGIDDNCAGGIDEGAAVGASTWYRDADNDSFGAAASTLARCAQPAGYVANADDCNDSTNQVAPGRTELCNGFDDNCAGGIDEGAPPNATRWYADADSDTWGNPGVSVVQCAAPAGYVSRADDCNDGVAAIRPGVAELTGDGVDQNCDGQETCFVDADNDGFRLTSTLVSANASCSDSGEAFGGEPTGDCDDAVGSTFPGAAESCNLVDDDCDGSVDDTGGACTVGVHRFRGPSNRNFYTASLSEGFNAGFTLIAANYYYLYNTPAPGLVPFYRCSKSTGGHLYTGDPNCELLGPSRFEGQLGWIALSQVPGSTQLLRAYRGSNTDHLYTIDPAELVTAIQTGGYTGELAAGWVWTAPR